MPLLEWNETFQLGIEQLDTHHQHLVELLNSAYDNFLEDSSVETLATTLDELFDCVIKHFYVESQYMGETSYSGYAEHLELSKSFSAQVEIMRKDIRAGWGNIPLEMLAFLKNWLTYNILIADASYIRSASESQWKQCA